MTQIKKAFALFFALWIHANSVHCTGLIEIQILFVSRHFQGFLLMALCPSVPKSFQHGNVSLFNGENATRIGDTKVSHCIFKTKHVACKITITGLRYIFNLK